MKKKLFVLTMLICSISLFAGCKNEKQKGKETSSIVLPKSIQSFLNTKYPDATVLDFDREQNGSEVKIKDKKIQKEIWFNTNDEWIRTEWDIRAKDVPVVIMGALEYSAYQQYTVKEVDVIEKPTGMYYVFDLKQDNNEVKITFDANGQIVK